MPSPELQLPVNVPWTLLGASGDMMDLWPSRRVGNPDTPAWQWASSVAIFGYEPDPDELPAALCDQRLTFLKISCSITGYQPPGSDLEAVLVAYPNVPSEQLSRLIGEYHACHGALLNVSVFPSPSWDTIWEQPPLSTFPRIVDFEPKNRDLYQAATEKGEVLTASKSGIKTDKSFTSVQSTETGLNMGAEVPIKGVKGKAGLSHEWGKKDTDSDKITRDGSQERRETEGSTTTISQMYSLLSGYHIGTNRAKFLILPRPHNLPPTMQQTFVQGVREIEGIQEFFLVVSRPKDQEALCIKASLETGHIVDSATFNNPAASESAAWETKVVETQAIFASVTGLHIVTDMVSGFFELFGAEAWRDEKPLDRTFEGFQQDGWTFDMQAGDTGHGPLEEVKLEQDNAGPWDLEDYDYKAIAAGDKIVVSGTVFTTRRNSSTSVRTFHRKYRVHLRRQKTLDVLQKENRSNLLIAGRDLSVCVSRQNGCLKPVGSDPPDLSAIDIVAEGSFAASSAQPILTQIRSGLLDDRRRQGGRRSFLDTDAFKTRILPALSEADRHRTLREVEGLPGPLVEALGADQQVQDALALDERDMMRRTGLSRSEVAAARRLLLALPQREAKAAN